MEKGNSGSKIVRHPDKEEIIKITNIKFMNIKYLKLAISLNLFLLRIKSAVKK